MVMGKDSQSKVSKALKSHINELEVALGRKLLEADLYRIIVEKASDEFRVDLEKKVFFSQCPTRRINVSIPILFTSI